MISFVGLEGSHNFGNKGSRGFAHVSNVGTSEINGRSYKKCKLVELYNDRVRKIVE